jgi:hypothetical protein
VFNELDSYVWKLTYKWAKWTHPHKPKRWIIARYFGAFNSSRRDRWVFGDRDSGAYLVKFAWTKITRHTLVKGWASPDDPALAGYWAARRRRGRPPLDRARLRLLQQQRGRCPLCGGLLLHADQQPQHPDERELWITATARRPATKRSSSTRDPEHQANPPPSVSSTPTADAASQTAPAVNQHFCIPDLDAFRACLSPVRPNGARRVLRRRRRSNASPLPDWKAPFYLLEAHGLECWLVNAKDVKHLPGRPKTDRLDAVWLCVAVQGRRAADAAPSFVPPPAIRRLRDLTRYRADLVGVRTAEKNRVEKLLEAAQIKLSVVASDIFGVSGRAMLEALVAGERDPKVLAQLARTRMRAKLGQLEEAFYGHFSDHHGFLLQTMLARIDQASADIATLEAHIEAEIAPFAQAADRLDEIVGSAGPPRR